LTRKKNFLGYEILDIEKRGVKLEKDTIFMRKFVEHVGY
jgi:hypothetical protein